VRYGETLAAKFLNHFKRRFGFKSPLSHELLTVSRISQPTPHPGQGLQQRLGVHEIRCRETFCVAPIRRCERRAGLLSVTLALPEPGEAHRGAQLPRLALLQARKVDGACETRFGSSCILR